MEKHTFPRLNQFTLTTKSLWAATRMLWTKNGTMILKPKHLWKQKRLMCITSDSWGRTSLMGQLCNSKYNYLQAQSIKLRAILRYTQKMIPNYWEKSLNILGLRKVTSIKKLDWRSSTRRKSKSWISYPILSVICSNNQLICKVRLPNRS